MIEYIIDGPLWYISLAVFTVGVVWQLAGLVLGKRKKDLSVPRGSAVPGAIKTVFGDLSQTGTWHRRLACKLSRVICFTWDCLPC